MFLPYLFIFSGTALAVLMISKRVEEKRKTPVFLLKIISKGEARCKEIHHRAVNQYSAGKERVYFFIAKQLPRYSRSSVNKALAQFEESMKKYLERLRDSRLLKKDDGISEYFKSMSEVEKGVGEINQEAFIAEEPATYAPEPAAKPKPRKPRKPRAKKIVVQEFVETE